MTFLTIIIGILVLGLVILIHELGHFIMAKRAGILCHEFSIGMGPLLYSKKKGETLYAIRAIPLGGYVSMAGEEVTSELIKPGTEIKVLREDNRITHMILNPEDERYPDAEKIYVESIDLQGKDNRPLTINHELVDEKAYYVFRNKELQVAPYDRSFDSKTLLERFLTIFAGPFMNIVLAFFLFIVISFFVGFPAQDAQGNVTTELGMIAPNSPADGHLMVGDEIIALEDEPIDSWSDLQAAIGNYAGEREIKMTLRRDNQEITLVLNPMINVISAGFSTPSDDDFDTVTVGRVVPNAPADSAGLKAGDIIVEIDQQPIDAWTDIVNIMEANVAGEAMTFLVERDNQTQELVIEPYPKEVIESQGYRVVMTQFGISPVYENNVMRSIFTAGFAGLAGAGTLIFDTLRLLFGGTVHVGELAGPVGIFSLISSAYQQGLITLLNFIAFLSVNLAIINLLPIPALDGGRLVFLGYEAITRRKVNKTVENYLHMLMFFLLIALILFVTYNDILRLLNLG